MGTKIMGAIGFIIFLCITYLFGWLLLSLLYTEWLPLLPLANTAGAFLGRIVIVVVACVVYCAIVNDFIKGVNND